jgi:CheY-like chemotaxis protein
MPIVDGFEVLSTVKADAKLKHIPIIVMSANDDNDTISKCLRGGADDYLIKPIRMQECKSLTQKLR